uniref:Uncharacterized protein n=1 Tax=Glossina pallidipes TaxID=7398 RepID=A0A1A9ZF12_GLOPL
MKTIDEQSNSVCDIQLYRLEDPTVLRQNVLIAATCRDCNCPGEQGLSSSRGGKNIVQINIYVISLLVQYIKEEEEPTDFLVCVSGLMRSAIRPRSGSEKKLRHLNDTQENVVVGTFQKQYGFSTSPSRQLLTDLLYIEYLCWGEFFEILKHMKPNFEGNFKVVSNMLCIHNWQLANNATFEKGRKKGNPDASDAFSSFTVTTRITFVPDDESMRIIIDLSTITGRLIDEIVTIIRMEIELSNPLSYSNCISKIMFESGKHFF